MSNASRAAVALCALTLAVPAVARAEDLTIVSTVTGGKAGSSTSTQYLSTDKVRTSDGETDTIMDLSTGRFTVVDNKRKEYWESSTDEMNAAMAKVQEQMKAMGPMMEKIMGKVGEVTVTKGANPRKVAGYDTEHWVVAMGDSLSYELWAAPSLTPPMPTGRYFEAMSARFSGLGPMGARFMKVFEEMRKIKGFPLAMNTSIKMMGQKQQTTTEATEVRKGPIAASNFQAPAGYKKVDSPLTKLGK